VLGLETCPLDGFNLVFEKKAERIKPTIHALKPAADAMQKRFEKDLKEFQATYGLRPKIWQRTGTLEIVVECVLAE
jgi:hypothetical protein